MQSKTVVIVGGGPTGLFLGLCLTRYNIDFIILEKRLGRDHHSKSIGLHPPSLDLLNRLGVAEWFMKSGVKIKDGVAFLDRVEVGRVAFDETGHVIPYILSLPQFQTEELLENALLERKPACIRKGIEQLSIHESDESVNLSWNELGTAFTLKADWVIGCDGKNSVVRQTAGIGWKGAPYSDTYIMADFPDTTPWPETGVLFFHEQGIVESFPLPTKKRRWVVKTNAFESETTPESVAKAVFERTGWKCDVHYATMHSSFGVQHFLAETFVSGRIILAGDAAHIISPIGGQGMNLGWLDAWELGEMFGRARLNGYAKFRQALQGYSKRRRKGTQVAMRNAFFNMAMGRKTRFIKLRKVLIKLVLAPFFRNALIRKFTMQN